MGILSLKPYLVHYTGGVPLIFLWILFLKTLKFLEVKSPEPIQKILKILQSQGDPKRAQVLQRFFWDRRIDIVAPSNNKFFSTSGEPKIAVLVLPSKGAGKFFTL